MNWSQHIKENGIENVYVAGFIDKIRNIFEFHPMYDVLYIKSAKLLFEIRVDEQLDFEVSVVDEIRCWFEIDEDDQFSISSMHSQIFKTEFDIRVSDIYIETKDNKILCIDYYQSDNLIRTVKIDPVTFFGFVVYNTLK